MLATLVHFFTEGATVRPLVLVNLMYAIHNLAEQLAKINNKRVESGSPTIKPGEWADYIQGTKQLWFDQTLPTKKDKVIKGMSNRDKALDLLAAVNQFLKSYELDTLPATAVVEVA